jgi:hypothetical protein
MASEIRNGRLQLGKSEPPHPRAIGQHWVDRFRTRHSEIQSMCTRQIDSGRYNATNADVVKMWFDAVTELRILNQYTPHRIYNMDELGFAAGTSRSFRAFVNIRERSSWKVVAGRQEWIVAIECISAAGRAVPLLVISKVKDTNAAWIPTHTPADWRFSTSSSGWTSDSHAYEWLVSIFGRLLIMDGHGSHITANVIAHCMEHAIDLLILPPHTSHILQPLDVATEPNHSAR